jgi:hypothetical protein
VILESDVLASVRIVVEGTKDAEVGDCCDCGRHGSDDGSFDLI